MMCPATRGDLVQSFREQARICARLGSPFTAQVMALAAEDLEVCGWLAELLGAWPGDPSGIGDAAAVRFAAALHALVLSGTAPRLADCYPPRAGCHATDLWNAAGDAVAEHRAFVEEFLASPPQTNEVRRSAVLMGGFLTVAEATSLPMRLLEIGASAGLNLIWDRYCYQLGRDGVCWGERSSPVAIATDWNGPLPPLNAALTVTYRAGCDRRPIDLENAGERLRLRSYVWADQPQRLALLDAAVATARQAGVRVAHADAVEWLKRELTGVVNGSVTVLYHSFVWQYMPAASRAAIEQVMEQLAATCTKDACLAWLRFETVMKGEAPELWLTLWPRGQHRLLATAHLHGSRVHWMNHRG
jgi:hypothetical protein